ncbi:MAG: hypothetical protein NT069_14325 [Planctomycetota bacterium]|nr:hypothetical protein [Planctomycetota bacterium]
MSVPHLTNRRARLTWLPIASAGMIACVAWQFLVSAVWSSEGDQKTLARMPLVFSDNFDEETPDRYEFADPKAWKWTKAGERTVLSQFQASKVENPVRSPFNRGLVKGLVLGDVVIDIDLQSTIKDYDHRDMCLFFGFQDPSHMYYVHFGKKADDHANQIFIVDGAPRKKISTKSTAGTNWTDNWHHARVIRRVESGSIEVYFDDMETPVMTAVDKTFTWGQVGFGTFDDTGNVDNLAIYGVKAERPAAK